MELVWLVETQHLESGDTDVELVASEIDLARYIEESFASIDVEFQVKVELVANHHDTVREWTVTAINDKEDYYVTATLHNVKVTP